MFCSPFAVVSCENTLTRAELSEGGSGNYSSEVGG
jgi:hypothetical protein